MLTTGPIRGALLVALLLAGGSYSRPVNAQTEAREFTGTIGRTLKIRIKLARGPYVMRGTYSYDRVGKDIRLAGAVSADGTFYLNEFDEKGNATAKFDGSFVTDDWMEGTWKPANGKKELPFAAQALDGRGIPVSDPSDNLSGEYRRTVQGRFDRHEATIEAWLLKDGRVRIAGESTWVGNAKTGNVNVGSADGVFGIQGGKVLFKMGDGEGSCRFTVSFGAGGLTVTDDNQRCGGLNVTFDGTYRKVGPPKS